MILWESSLNGYPAVAYSQLEKPDGNHVQFVAAKTCVTPTSGKTIPSIELLAALNLARLTTNVFCALSLELPLGKSLSRMNVYCNKNVCFCACDLMSINLLYSEMYL